MGRNNCASCNPLHILLWLVGVGQKNMEAPGYLARDPLTWTSTWNMTKICQLVGFRLPVFLVHASRCTSAYMYTCYLFKPLVLGKRQAPSAFNLASFCF